MSGRGIEALREHFGQLFHKLANELASGKAVLREESFVDRELIDLCPSNPRAARIRVILPKNRAVGVITLVVGKGTIFEIPEGGGQYTEHYSAIEETEAICRAVLAGRFRERVKMKGSEVVSSRGTVDLPPAVTVRGCKTFHNPFRPATVIDRHYEAY